ncbi:MAG TPA: hypothetical protein VG710_14970 [Opitutus sp.]|nr:hypothetical protein [Opitutus sp.]
MKSFLIAMKSFFAAMKSCFIATMKEVIAPPHFPFAVPRKDEARETNQCEALKHPRATKRNRRARSSLEHRPRQQRTAARADRPAPGTNIVAETLHPRTRAVRPAGPDSGIGRRRLLPSPLNGDKWAIASFLLQSVIPYKPAVNCQRGAKRPEATAYSSSLIVDR